MQTAFFAHLTEISCRKENDPYCPPSQQIAGWSSPVARQAHNLKVVGSNPTPATTFQNLGGQTPGFFLSPMDGSRSYQVYVIRDMGALEHRRRSACFLASASECCSAGLKSWPDIHPLCDSLLGLSHHLLLIDTHPLRPRLLSTFMREGYEFAMAAREIVNIAIPLIAGLVLVFFPQVTIKNSVETPDYVVDRQKDKMRRIGYVLLFAAGCYILAGALRGMAKP